MIPDDFELELIDEHGNSIDLDVISYIKNENTGINYIVYTDNIKDKNGEDIYYASELVQDGDFYKLKEIDDKELVNEILSEIDKSFEDNA